MVRTATYSTREERKTLLDAATAAGEVMLHDDFGTNAKGEIEPPHTLTFDTFVEPPVDPTIARRKALRLKLEDETITHGELVEFLKTVGI